MVEQGTHNPLVGGSNPSGPTIEPTIANLTTEDLLFCRDPAANVFRNEILPKRSSGTNFDQNLQLFTLVRFPCLDFAYLLLA